MDGLGTQKKSCSTLCYKKLVKALITDTHNNKLWLLKKAPMCLPVPHLKDIKRSKLGFLNLQTL